MSTAVKYRRKAHGLFALGIFIILIELVLFFGIPVIAWILTIPVIMIFRAAGRNLGIAKGLERRMRGY